MNPRSAGMGLARMPRVVTPLRSTRSDHPQRDRLEHGAGAVAGVELVEDRRDVILDRAFGEEHRTGDLAVGVAAGEQPQYRDLPRGEAFARGVVGVVAVA